MNHTFFPIVSLLVLLGTAAFAPAQEEIKITKKIAAKVEMASGLEYEGFLFFLDSKAVEFQRLVLIDGTIRRLKRDPQPVRYLAKQFVKVWTTSDGGKTFQKYSYNEKKMRFETAVAKRPANPPADTDPAADPEPNPESSAGKGQNWSKTVRVRGVGTDVEKAEADAIMQAAQQVVGLYVDSTTIVKNEKLSETILTFTQAKIYSAERVKGPKKKDGLVHVELKVTVAVAELKALLRKYNFTVKAVPGEQIAKEIEVGKKLKQFQADLEKKVAVNLAELLAQFSLAKMLKPVELQRKAVENGEIEVRFQLEPDLLQWHAYKYRLLNALRKTTPARPFYYSAGPLNPNRRKSRTFAPNTHFLLGRDKNIADIMKDFQQENNLKWGHYLYVLTNWEEKGDPAMTSYFRWAVYPVPKQVYKDLKELQPIPVKVIVSLVDKGDRVIEETMLPLADALHTRDKRSLFFFSEISQVSSVAMIAPFPWFGGPWFVVRPEPCSIRLPVNADDVQRIAKVIVHVE